jgi:hypothetical protein
VPVSACKNAKILALSRELLGPRDHEMQYPFPDNGFAATPGGRRLPRLPSRRAPSTGSHHGPCREQGGILDDRDLTGGQGRAPITECRPSLADLAGGPGGGTQHATRASNGDRS